MVDRVDRDRLIQQEQNRQRDYKAKVAELTAEYNSISAPVLEYRRIEQRMNEISTRLSSLGEHNSATHAQYKRDLENALPDGLPQMMRAGQAELGQRRHRLSATEIDRLASVRRWLDQVELARRDPSKTGADLEALADAGRALGLTGTPKAFDEPERMVAS